MVRIGICDDDRQYQGVMESMLEELCGLHRLQAEIEVYTGGAELLEDLDTGGCLDLLFLDIEMKGMDGIQTALRIRKENRYMLIVYVSSHEEYLRQLFEAEPFRFLKKPVQQNELEKVVIQAMERISSQKQLFYTVQSGRNYIRLPYQEILFLESSGRKVIIHTDDRAYQYYGKLDEAESALMGGRFIRIHKAYLINMDNTEVFQYDKVALKDGTVLSISEKNRPKVRNLFWEYCGKVGSKNE